MNMGFFQRLSELQTKSKKYKDNASKEDFMELNSGGQLPESIAGPDYEKKIRLWTEIYCGRAPWLEDRSAGLNLASAVASEISRLVTSELKVSVSGSERAEFISGVLNETLLPKLRVYTEYACACGGIMFKPVFDEGRIAVDVMLPDSFIPTQKDGGGNITGACFIERIEKGDKLYTRAEQHTPKDGGYLITNKAFVSSRYDKALKGIPVASVPEWKSIRPVTFIENLDGPLFSYFAIPLGNTENIASPLGVSVFARAVPMLYQADRQFGRLVWEFEGGELAVDASEDAFKIGRDGNPILPFGKERLFRPNNLDSASSDGDLFKVFSPELRDQSLLNGLNRMIMSVEDLTGIARGTFSDPDSVAKTATEIKSMKQRTYSTVNDIQRSLREAICRLVSSIDGMASLYRLSPEGKTELLIDFGDGVLTDRDAEKVSDLEEVKCGVMTPEEFRAKWHGNLSPEMSRDLCGSSKNLIESERK